MIHKPFVSVIIPTTHDRKKYNEDILNMYCRQDYPYKELLWDFSDEKIGTKRNMLCGRARGEVIVHFDSDDKYGDDWISRSVQCLIEKEADIVGLRKLNFYNEVTGEGWAYTYPSNMRAWCAGATLCYWRSYWERTLFYGIQVSEDTTFTNRTSNIWAHDYVEGFLASIHEGNTSRRNLGDGSSFRRCSEEENIKIRKRFFGT